MIVCGNCGHQNDETDAFCGNCGQFLEWVGQKVEEPAPPAQPEPEPESAEAAPGLIGRIRQNERARTG